MKNLGGYFCLDCFGEVDATYEETCNSCGSEELWDLSNYRQTYLWNAAGQIKGFLRCMPERPTPHKIGQLKGFLMSLRISPEEWVNHDFASLFKETVHSVPEETVRSINELFSVVEGEEE